MNAYHFVSDLLLQIRPGIALKAFPRYPARVNAFLGIALGIAIWGMWICSAHAAVQIFTQGYKVTGTTETFKIGEYNLDGTVVNSSLFGSGGGGNVTVSGGAAYFVVPANPGGVIKYDAMGNTTDIIDNLNMPIDVAISGTNLFVANYGNGSIGKYDTSGTAVNAAFIVGLNSPAFIAASEDGQYLYVTEYSSATVKKFSATTGALIDAALITEATPLAGLVETGGNLFVVNSGDAAGDPHTGFISEYTSTGTLVNATLVTGLNNPQALALSDGTLYVANLDDGTIGAYLTDGTTVDTTLISGLNNVFAVGVGEAAAIPTPTPAPTVSVVPVLTFAGKKKITTPKASYALKGTSSAGTTSVEVKVGKAKAKEAKGTSHWKFKAKLLPGRNKITIIAHGPGGDSAPVKILVVRS